MPESLDQILPSAFVERRKEELEKPSGYEPEIEDVIEAEFLMKFGFEAYWALHPEKDRAKGINGTEMSRIIAASRKVDFQQMYKDAQASFIGAVSAQSKSPGKAFSTASDRILKNSEVKQ